MKIETFGKKNKIVCACQKATKALKIRKGFIVIGTDNLLAKRLKLQGITK